MWPNCSDWYEHVRLFLRSTHFSFHNVKVGHNCISDFLFNNSRRSILLSSATTRFMREFDELEVSFHRLRGESLHDRLHILLDEADFLILNLLDGLEALQMSILLHFLRFSDQ